MTEYVLSFDPGVSTGVALLGYNEVEPAYLIKAWQFSNGVSGLLSWLGEHWRVVRAWVETFSYLSIHAARGYQISPPAP